MQNFNKYIYEGLLFDGRYRLIKLLSTEGGTADVWLAENYDSIDTKLSEDTDDIIRVEGSGVLVAIKIYRPKNILDIDGEHNFRSEFKTIFNCRHSNLLPTTDYSICDGIPYLVMPFCENGSAESLIGKLNNENDIWKFLTDVSIGLSYLHSIKPQIIHQDIKPANILIDSNKNYCITDFGISVKSGGVEDNQYRENESSGTTIYMPPERFKDGYKPDASSDIWSFGATIYEILTGDVPFGNYGGAAQLEGRQIPPIKKNISKRIKNIVYACLNADPQKRPSAEYIAEYSKRKGRNNHIIHIIISLIAIGILLSVITWSSKEKELEPFLVYKNSGDSIISLHKQEANEFKLINYGLTLNRLNNAKNKYTKALKETYEDKSTIDSIQKRITSIQDIIIILKEYKGICDTLDIAIIEDLPTQVDIFSERRDSISKILKNKINNL